MTPPDNEQTNKKSNSKDDKTVVLQRCPKHATLYMPNEGCPECAKEKNASGG